MQEPASVLFSLMNLYAHMKGLESVKTRITDGHPMKGYYRLWALVNINAWIWSSVFHTRGGCLYFLKSLTEKSIQIHL